MNGSRLSALGSHLLKMKRCNLWKKSRMWYNTPSRCYVINFTPKSSYKWYLCGGYKIVRSHTYIIYRDSFPFFARCSKIWVLLTQKLHLRVQGLVTHSLKRHFRESFWLHNICVGKNKNMLNLLKLNLWFVFRNY